MTSWHLLPVNFVNICSVTNTRILFTTHRLESRNGVAVAVRNINFKEVFFWVRTSLRQVRTESRLRLRWSSSSLTPFEF